MTNSHKKFTAVVLAADRSLHDPVAKAAGMRCKSFVPVGGRPMVLRVLDALDASQRVNTYILCGPPKAVVDQQPDLETLITSGKIKWFENQATPSASAFHVLQSLPGDTPVLLTTADHALLSARIVDYFCLETLATACDVVVGVARHEVVAAAYPQTRRTATRLKDGAYCGCNLFAFLTPRARLAATFWRQIEDHRKNPFRLIRILGWGAVLHYLMGRLSLNDALDRLSHRLGFKAGAVVLPCPEAAVDVDSVSDLRLVENLISNKQI